MGKVGDSVVAFKTPKAPALDEAVGLIVVDLASKLGTKWGSQ